MGWNAEPYRTRRRSLVERVGGGPILVRGAGADGVNPSFLYLTGIAEPRGALLLAPDGVRVGTGRAAPGRDYVRGRIVRDVLFLPPRDALAARWGEDAAATVEGVPAAEVGLDEVLPLARLEPLLDATLPRAGRLHVVRGHAPSTAGEDDPDTRFVDRIRRRFFDLRLGDATAAVHEMRRAKDDSEVAAIERSIAVTAAALDRAFARIAPGALEHEVEAEIAREYRAHGGIHAFEPIVAGGPNANRLHYTRNASRLAPGTLVLLDTGVSIGGYKSDVTRTVPVDGRFTRRQREVYDVVLRALEETIARCRPGALLGDLHAAAFDVIAGAGFGEHFPHGIGHHLGLETHDVGDPHLPLEPGAVITVEPGIYLEDEGLGIRIEDDVLVTAGGNRVLTAAIPRSAEAIEARLAELRR